MKCKTISLVVLLVLILPASLSCTQNSTREQSSNIVDLTTPSASATAVITTDEPSNSAMTRLYFEVIKDVYSEDSGLNEGISIISLDLSGANNLSAEEKEDLRYLVSSEYSFDTYTYTYEELVGQGLIDEGLIDDELMDEEISYFEKGILFEITDTPITDNAFTFQIEKYRSGIGAIAYSECTAKKTGDTWEYTLGGAMMA